MSIVRFQINLFLIRVIPHGDRPFNPGLLTIDFLERHKHFIAFQPLLVVNPFFIILGWDKLLKCLLKICMTEFLYVPIVNGICVFRIIRHMAQQTVLFQQFQGNVDLVHCEGRERLVGAVPESKRI